MKFLNWIRKFLRLILDGSLHARNPMNLLQGKLGLFGWRRKWLHCVAHWPTWYKGIPFMVLSTGMDGFNVVWIGPNPTMGPVILPCLRTWGKLTPIWLSALAVRTREIFHVVPTFTEIGLAL
jgi:hypothetical protein